MTGEFYILALSQGQVRLLRGTRNSVEGVDLQNIPESLAESLKYTVADQQLQYHTGTREPAGTGGRRPVIFHGHGAGKDAGDNDILNFFHEIDKGITGNPDDLRVRPEELHQRAWEIVRPIFESAQAEVAERYRALMGQRSNRATDRLEDIVPAAFNRRVDVLFAATGSQQWGTYNTEDNRVELHPQPGRGDADLLDVAAMQTVLNGGTVYVVPPERMPGTGTAAAVFRY